MKRRQALAVLLSGLAVAAGARAQGYPTKTIRVIVGYTAGGAVDIVARAVAQQLQASMGQPVIIENKPGGGTNIALRALIDSPPDGYTLMLTANAIAANMSLYQPPPYDLARDVTPISLVGRVPVVLAVSAQSEYKTLGDLIAAAKAKPEAVNYASPGNGSTPHLAVELFERAAGISLTHVPYKGGVAGDHRRHRRPRAGGGGQRARSAAAGQRRQAARAGGDDADALGDLPRRADGRGVRLRGLRGVGLVRLHRSRGACRLRWSRGCTPRSRRRSHPPK